MAAHKEHVRVEAEKAASLDWARSVTVWADGRWGVRHMLAGDLARVRDGKTKET